MIRDGEIKPGMYRVTTHAGETMDLQVTGVDHRDQGDYLIFLPQSQPNPDRAITVDSKLPVGDIALFVAQDGSVWRSNDMHLTGVTEVPAGELDSIREWHEASSPVATPAVQPASGGVPPQPQGSGRPQTADSDRDGVLTGADIGQGHDARQNSESAGGSFDPGYDPLANDANDEDDDEGPNGEDDTAGTSDDDTTPAGELAPKVNAPVRPGLRSRNEDPSQHQNAVQHIDHDVIDHGAGNAEQQNLNQGQHPTITDRPEHLYEDQYQPTVGTGQTPDGHFGDGVTPEQAQFMENEGMNPPPGGPDDPMTSKDISPNDANKNNPVYAGPGDSARAAEDLNVEKEPPHPD